MADEACHIELDRCRKPIGKQDQYIAAYGGLQYIRFNPDGSVFADPVICSSATRKRLESRLLLLYTGLTRSADGILAEQGEATRSSEEKRASLRRMVAWRMSCARLWGGVKLMPLVKFSTPAGWKSAA